MSLRPPTHESLVRALHPELARGENRAHYLDRMADPNLAAAEAIRREPRWKALRDWFFDTHPLCAECERFGLTVPGRDVDHIVSIVECLRTGHRERCFDLENLQTLCRPHHNEKTRAETRARPA